jgi:hypothetical protein
MLEVRFDTYSQQHIKLFKYLQLTLNLIHFDKKHNFLW